MIPLAVPNLAGNELKYASEAIKSEWVSSSGPLVTSFEEKMAQYLGVPSAVACQSGTSGLHLALLALGIGADDEVVVPTLTFIATVNPVKYVGAHPVLMDCDETLSLDPVKLARFCEEQCDFKTGILINNKTKRKVRAIIVVHVFGNLADMEAILKIARKFNLLVIEDACEALGTKYLTGASSGKFAGTLGDVGVYSFNGNKIITTGGGGLIVSASSQLLQQVKHLSTQAKSDPLNFSHDQVGYNYRMTNLQAALGLAQLEQLEDFITIKNQNYDYYQQLLTGLDGLSLLPFRAGTRSNKWFYSLMITSDYPLTNQQLLQFLARQQIQTRPIWGLIHQQQPYRLAQKFWIEQALFYHDHVLNLPCSTNLKSYEIETVVNNLKEARKVCLEWS